MLKHRPFGWVKDRDSESYEFIDTISDHNEFIKIFDEYTFADGTPFGIKED